LRSLSLNKLQQKTRRFGGFCTFQDYYGFSIGGGNDDLPQNSLKASAPRNSLIINAEVISHNHFPTTRPEKRISPMISRHRTRVTGLQ